MPLFVTVLSGPCAAEAQPVLALSDQRAVRAVLHAIGQLADLPHTELPANLRAVRARVERANAGE